MQGASAGLTPLALRKLYGAEADEILALGDHISSLEDTVKPGIRLAWSAAMAQAA
jgi:phosphonate transport system ATP-binding protein